MTMSHVSDIQEALKKDVSAQKKVFADAFKDLAWDQTYSKGRVVLLGDAGFCPSALTGMGTSLALVGAYILAGEIGRNGRHVKAAFAAYDAVLRPGIDKVQALNVQAIKWLYPKSKAAVRVIRLVLGLMYRFNVHTFFQNRVMDHREQDGWEMPRYEELHRLEGSR
ncbi:hypothetical protein J3458_021327 [Metarhizium acridum]|uniref:uncharacterized protein n=1 Tax=Metarhizium acridum TaxID=92637 RepID=UPI001C6D2557|nr:hypothetical protein J3458_021327 [Metarhizium acridum]